MGTDPRNLVDRLVISRYHVSSIIGVGGLCTVYRAEDLRRGREVALKVLPIEKAQVKELAARFQREVVTTKRIEHPNVATISDSGSLDDGALFLVMELLQGRLLATQLQAGRLPQARALSIARQMLSGLAAAHALGIVHRDIKPDNVMLLDAPDGSGEPQVKLFDFGIASNERAAMKLTAPGTAFGTPEYISPEMATGQKVDARADLYSVGVVLFEMLAGRMPFVRQDGIEYLRAHVNEAPPRPSEVAPEAGISTALDEVVLRALAKKADDRHASAKAMIDAIDRVTGAQARRRRARSRAWLAISVSLAAATAALMALRFLAH